MKIVNVGEDSLELYSSVKEMPMKRYNEFRKYEVYARNGYDDPKEQLIKCISLVSDDKKDLAIKNLANLYQAMYAKENLFSPNQYCFALFVSKINGVDVYDISEEGLSRAIDMLDTIGFTQEMLESELDSLKKK